MPRDSRIKKVLVIGLSLIHIYFAFVPAYLQ